MKCPHCLDSIYPSTTDTHIQTNMTPRFTFGTWKGDGVNILARCHVCPNCAGPIVELHFTSGLNQVHDMQAFPRGAYFLPAPAKIPGALAKDYGEANEVLAISPKASAALSRRCLQTLLNDAGYESSNLAKQVDDALDEESASKALPLDLKDSLDAIRNFGNFSAHPIDDKTTLQIIDVDVGEAEWSLQLVYELFQHYYVRPAKAADRRSALNAKLKGPIYLTSQLSLDRIVKYG